MRIPPTLSLRRRMLNHKALDYGNLAKSFGIRDAPGDIRVSGGGATLGGKWRGSTTGPAATITSAKEGAKRSLGAEDTPDDAGPEAVRKMRKIAFGILMKERIASEFDIR